MGTRQCKPGHSEAINRMRTRKESNIIGPHRALHHCIPKSATERISGGGGGGDVGVGNAADNVNRNGDPRDINSTCESDRPAGGSR